MSAGVDIRGPLHQLVISVAQKDALSPATYAGMSVRCYDATPPNAEFFSDGSAWQKTGGGVSWDAIIAGANPTANLAISPGTTANGNIFGGHTDVDGGRNTTDPSRSGAVRIGLNSSAAVIRAASLYKGHDLNAWGNANHVSSSSVITVGGAGTRLVSIADAIDTIALGADMNQGATEIFMVSSGSAFNFIAGGNLDISGPRAVADGDIWWAFRSDITNAKWKLTKIGEAGGPPSWTDATLALNWSNSGAPFFNIGYALEASGRVNLRGAAARAFGASGNGTPLMTMPAGTRPGATIFLNAKGTATGSFIEIDPDGSVTVFGTDSSELNLDGLSYWAA